MTKEGKGKKKRKEKMRKRNEKKKEKRREPNLTTKRERKQKTSRKGMQNSLTVGFRLPPEKEKARACARDFKQKERIERKKEKRREKES